MLGRRDAGLGCAHLGFGYKVLAVRIVDFLLRDKTRPLFSDFGETGVGKVRDRMRGLSPLQLISCARQLRLTSAQHRFRAYLVVGHFGDFDQCQELSFFHSVTDIDVDLLHIAGDLGHDVNFLKRLELRGQHKSAGNIFYRSFCDGDGGCIRNTQDLRLGILGFRAGRACDRAD